MKKIALFSLLSLLFSSGIMAMEPAAVENPDANAQEKALLALIGSHDAEESNIEKLQKLIIKGVDLNYRDKLGNTALHRAANRDHTARSPEKVEMLILGGADVNAKNNGDQTPLHWAAFSNNIPAIKLLIKAGADKNATDIDGKTPWDYATSQEAEELLK